MRFLGENSGHAKWQRVALAWALVLAPFLLWGELAEDVWKRESFRFDEPILLWMNSHSNLWLDRVMLGLSLVGGYPLLFVSGALFLFLLLTSQRRNALLWCCASAASARST